MIADDRRCSPTASPLVANMIAEDGGKEIVAGNERVLRARLSDAKFFWDEDRKHTLESRVEALRASSFTPSWAPMMSGWSASPSWRAQIAAKIGADPKKAGRAARLAKADLTTGVVGEFPELQGVMGALLRPADKEDADVADAIRDHYKPRRSRPMRVPDGTDLASPWRWPTSWTACSDFSPSAKSRPAPRDPFALRRAGLGIIRIILETGCACRSRDALAASSQFDLTPQRSWGTFSQALRAAVLKRIADDLKCGSKIGRAGCRQVLAFMADRLKVALSERGVRHDLSMPCSRWQ